MVIKLEAIPLHLQKRIGDMMNLEEFRNLAESSKQGRTIGRISTPTKDITFLEIDAEDMSIVRFSAVGAENRKAVLWSVAKLQENCPRFKVFDRIFVKIELSDERGREIIRELENRLFLGRNGSLEFEDAIRMELNTFVRFLETFNVANFSIIDVDPVFWSHPIMSKMDYVSLSTISDDDLLSLSCPGLLVEADNLNINVTINKFLKQWMDNEREITDFSLLINHGSAWSETEIMKGLPFEILWSPVTHSSSFLSALPLDGLEDQLGIGQMKAKTFSYLSNGTKTLSIAFYETQIRVDEIDQMKKVMLKRISPENYRILTGLCRSCQKEECECPPTAN